MTRRNRRILPGFGLSLGFTIFYISLVLLIPLSMLFLKATVLSWDRFWQVIASQRVLAAFRLSFTAAFFGGLLNAFFGPILAWVLTRYRFPGRRFLDALVDLPFAIPTAVAGIALTSLYAPNGWLGRFFAPLGIKIAFTPAGIVTALTFIGLPFVVRTIQPVLAELDCEVEEAAASLGANRWQTIYRVILPALTPSWLTGFALAFARGLGEYGSVVFIAGNMPYKTEIVPLLIVTKLEQFDYVGATAIAVVMLVLSFIILLLINIFQWFNHRRYSAS